MIALTFRPATEDDVPTLRMLAAEIWWACYPPIIGNEQVEYMLGWMYSEDVIRGEMRNGVAWEIAYAGHQPVGFLSLTRGDEPCIKVNKLYLRPELHGRGFGQALINRARALGHQLGGQSLRLQVNKRNERAIKAYQRAGFQIEREAVFEIGNGFVMDDFILVLDLNASAGEAGPNGSG